MILPFDPIGVFMMFFSLGKKTALLSFGLFTLHALYFSPSSMGSEAACYSFALPSLASHEGKLRQEVWCYQRLEEPSKDLFIFNGDGPAKAELSLLVGREGDLTQGSLTQGVTRFHHVPMAHFNPLPVPLEEPVGPVANRVPLRLELAASVQTLLAQLQRAQEKARPALLTTLSAPGAKLAASANFLPWRGYWWPFRERPLAEPLEKFDHFVGARTGWNPESSRWEYDHHHASSLFNWWEGHCNGWAAAAILRPEPKAPFYDATSGVTFRISDLKGILTEADNCARVAFIGNRNNGEAGDDPLDPNPALFHKALLYYIGQLHRPLAMDYHASARVDTSVISAYGMEMTSIGPNQFDVRTTLRLHTYDDVRSEVPGDAPSHESQYRYRLTVNERGEAITGEWISENPDFLWAALGAGSCDISNPLVSLRWADELSRLSSPQPKP